MNALRDWWRHRNDPPAMLPDPVRYTPDLYLLTPQQALDLVNASEDLTAQGGDKWRIVEGTDPVVFQRDDGAYRYRDDAFKGF
jgi:hypothetical protein